MKNLKIIYTILALSISAIACKKVLEPKTDSTFGDESTWSLPNKAEGVLINAYANIPNRFDSYAGNNFLDAATDNAVSNNYGSGIFQLGAGGLSPLDNPIGEWYAAYSQFRNINIFLEKGLTPQITYDLTSKANDVIYKQRLKGEAFYLRAYWGFRLLQQYGGKTASGTALGYPILLKILSDTEVQNLNIARNTYEECVTQILADCDTAFKYLPIQYGGQDLIVGDNQIGRADKRTCLALKSRTSLYAASPAYQPNTITQITGMGIFTVNDAGSYSAKWIKATSLAQDAINLIGNFTSLSKANFNSITTPTEFLWRRYGNNRFSEISQYPPLEYGDAITGPSQNLVEAFPARNGYPISDTRSGFDPNNPYANRDSRLDLNVYYNTSPISTRILETFVGGLDSKTRFANATRTGYYVRKWLTGKNNLLNPESPQNDFHYHVMFRKTEIYLNFAEAANEAYGPNAIPPGATKSASTVIKDIRKAAGLTAVTSDAYVTEIAAAGKDAFRRLIQNERRLELAFEGQRYFDMRRWLLPLTEAIKGVNIVKTATNTFQYSNITVEPRKFDNIKFYYLPLPYAETSKSPSLINNLGW